jgi:N-methylhydantoinase A/oxoprolinase/acetone carboxylase beta subunit
VYQVGIDIGGTFTDAVLVGDDGGIAVAKVPTTPADLRECFFDAIDSVTAEAGLKPIAERDGLRLTESLIIEGDRVSCRMCGHDATCQ